MKKFCIILSLAGVMAVPNLFASLSVTLYQDTSNFSDNNYGGGEFRAVGNSGLDSVVNWGAYTAATSGTTSGQQYFQTFCTELQEEFYPGTSYNISSIGNNALYNNNGGTPIPITLGVAYLYSQFAAGTLGGYDYTYGSGRVASAENLQYAIWTLLGESAIGVTGAALADLKAVTGSGSGDIFATSADWYSAANGAYGVRDMVLGNPGQNQDQLVMDPVPEPTTMIAGALLLLPFGASTLRILRKRQTA